MRAAILANNTICHLCGLPGADTIDHIIPVHTDPARALDPTNLAPAHGRRSPTCIGNYARHDNPLATQTKHSRNW